VKSPYVNELKPEQTITGLFLVQQKDIRQKKTGDPYLSLTLTDKTGELDAKMWDHAAEVMDTFDRDDFVKVKGLVQVFQNRLQLTIHKLQRVADAEVDFADYFPASMRDPGEMERELLDLIGAMKNAHLRQLLEVIFLDDALRQAYKMAPAAKSIHHAFLSGLIEHVLSLAKLAQFTAAHYPGVDGDLLMAGVILHDIGKVWELAYERGFSYTDEGQLIGHIVMGVKFVAEKVRQVPGFPPKLQTLLEHLILSHHGELAFGSPKVPLFREALLLHHLDNLDSKMETMRAAVAQDQRIDGNWTAYHGALERAVLKKLRYLEGAPGEAKTAPAVAAAAPATPSRSSSPFGDKLLQALKP
jgi:3'-5' exoribonuclease